VGAWCHAERPDSPRGTPEHDRGDARRRVSHLGGKFFATAEEITDKVIASLDGSKAPRQFHWFHYFDPHSPYGSSRGEKLLTGDILIESRRRGLDAAIVLTQARDG